MKISPKDQTEYRDALQALEEALDEAYWKATPDAKDMITALTQSIADIITDLNQSALDDATPRYKKLKEHNDLVSAKLKKAIDDINDWVHAVKVAANVAKLADQALKIAVKVFPI